MKFGIKFWIKYAEKSAVGRSLPNNKGSRLKIQRLLHHLNEFQEPLPINPWSTSTSSLFHYLQADIRILLRPLRRSDSAHGQFSASTQKNLHFMEGGTINKTDTRALTLAT
ncbi:hypothetical protein AVEN_88289-1 [Araneus ventricosus]|uniref:Uncharacterized protein n=1 Tax=Araneus ventricosus TaxID=182803 RepID=A0A4Y2SDU6_ARAVE|nr:hypothetical protein AVEN_88289-1 [Araneus ventricosus]